ncbi:hypothetical protein [Streptomyces murinus]|uniref:acyl-CoA-like ligand-binding transcription factor n=2 Tax=Streptomyces murinus TaxID=33900 RepID=UPI003990C21E
MAWPTPLLAAGADRWRALLEATEPGTALPQALEAAVEQALSVPDEESVQALLRTRGLLRAAADDPALRAVWYRVNQEAEERLVPVIARLTGRPAEQLEVRLAAAAATDAIRVALESWADTEAGAEGPGSPAGLATRCLRQLVSGMPPLGERADRNQCCDRTGPPSR